jgi:hypothetical protein
VTGLQKDLQDTPSNNIRIEHEKKLTRDEHGSTGHGNIDAAFERVFIDVFNDHLV